MVVVLGGGWRVCFGFVCLFHYQQMAVDNFSHLPVFEVSQY